LNHRLYIVSGKGGTGKTSFSLALSRLLHKNGKKVQYTAFDHEADKELLNNLEVPFFDTTIEKSCEKYIGLKLKSLTIAKWIMRTPFFSALFSILPSLGSMILLGHFIKELEDDRDLVLVLDSPSTGHAKAMIEATNIFKEIFRAGVLVEDIHRMHSFLHNPTNVKSYICSLPTEMSIQEAGELKSFMLKKELKNTSLVLNNFISENDAKETSLSFLKQKINSEKEILGYFHESHAFEILLKKHFKHDQIDIIKKIETDLESYA